jgi:hypothetical protein
MMVYEYVEVTNQGNIINEFVSSHLKITLSNGNIVRVFDNAGDMNIVELFDGNDEIIAGVTEDELAKHNEFQEFII